MVFEGLFARVRNSDRSAEATTAPLRPAATRPTIGLALGGGAARGFAHIGVMRRLEAARIVPDVIVGGKLDTAAMKPIARCGYDEYAVVERVFAMQRPLN